MIHVNSFIQSSQIHKVVTDAPPSRKSSRGLLYQNHLPLYLECSSFYLVFFHPWLSLFLDKYQSNSDKIDYSD